MTFESRDFAIAPASKLIYGAEVLSDVKQIMPYFYSDNSEEIVLTQLSPFSISSGEKRHLQIE